MKTTHKIIMAIVAVIVIAVFGVGIYWFSLPSELRNMLTWIALPGASYENHEVYQPIDRNEAPLLTTTFDPVVAETTDDDTNSNITVITQMVQNEVSSMFKLASVQPNGAEDYTGWQLVADEGMAEGVATFGPTPLSYMTSGIAANLHTQILRAAEVMEVELDNVSVEVLNKFRWDNMLSAEGAGFLDETYTNIIIESDESEETIQNLLAIAINAWTAGEALGNETTIETALVVNGDHWENYRATPGTTLSDEAYVDGLEVAHIIDGPEQSAYLPQAVEEDAGILPNFNDMSNMEFEILAISESAEDPDRPYLKRITVSFNTPDAEIWEIYSDELNGVEGSPAAPTSLEYLTAGTGLCLTSQLTLVSTMMDLDYTDFRVEQQIDYREESVNSTEMAGYADTVHTYVVVESDESEERLDRFYQQSLSMCFAGEAFKGATDMYTNAYLNGNEIEAIG